MFQAYFENYKADFIAALGNLDFSDVNEIYQVIEKARRNRQQVFVIGNGGSAASAAHWGCDFGKGINVGDSERLKITTPVDGMTTLTALANDISYDDIFKEMLKNQISENDVVIALSVSGDSENLIKALDFAKKKNALTVAIIGEKKGRVKDYSDLTLIIPSEDYGIVEDLHMFINHVISQFIKQQNNQALKSN
ncbi:D-sedoheptulose 7-phosphate isomerase [Scopulibacillus darangshiensis]|uniref:D-sedoheptulose 7-phosphate isomerase n=1 Tax=Scopulibacillus darangshiensis TaxID=442528 RepID=A0A4R2NMY1_9BACL|nr:SIS domain-containing protein [Scopulibacillus darangshiensis]TCP22665.1 D-sedoheptulose 7-phosphate isomerase [Scopulibacillus darangshiensis]